MTFVDETLDTIAICGPSPPVPSKSSITQRVEHATPSSPTPTLPCLQTSEALPGSQHIVSPDLGDAESPDHESTIIQVSPQNDDSSGAILTYRHTDSSFIGGPLSISDLASPSQLTFTPETSKRSVAVGRFEAELLQYFVEHLASSFDLTDRARHFRTAVPQYALDDPVLLNAVCAASCRHRARVSNGDPLAAERYHDRCLQHLIPVLSDDSAVMNENLLAATVILRYLEEIDVPLSGPLEDSQPSHLIGTSIFVTAQGGSTRHGGLRQAAFWTGIRQEIYIAFVQQRPVHSAFLEAVSDDIVFGSASEDIWANRSVLHCARVISYCFDKERDHKDSRPHLDLLRWADDWMTQAPRCFSPIFRAEADADNVFPDIVYCSDAVVTGLQHHHLARILLSSHNPGIPTLGLKRTLALRQMDDEIRGQVGELIGLATSNARSAPNFVTASMAIAMTGDKFSELDKRLVCLHILRVTEQSHGWPTTRAQQDLKEAWGWDVLTPLDV